MTPVDELGPGDIGAVAKLKETRAGDVLSASGEAVRFPALELPAPVMAFAYEAKSKGDEEKAATAIRRLVRGGPDARRPPRPADRRADHRRAHAGPRRGDRRPDEAPLRRRDRAAPAAGAVPRDDPQAGQGPRPLQEADRRPRPVRRLPHRDRARRAGRGLRVRQRDQGRRDPGQLHPGGREGDRRGDGRRRPRRLSDQGRQGAPVRRPAPHGRLLGDGVQDRRLDGLQAGGRRGRAVSARADREADDLGARGRRSAT